MEASVVSRLSEQMAVMSSQMDGLLTSVGEMKKDIRNLSDAAPIHRIAELERWRNEAKDKVNNVPELVRWKTNVGRVLAGLAVGLIVALASAIFSIIIAR